MIALVTPGYDGDGGAGNVMRVRRLPSFTPGRPLTWYRGSRGPSPTAGTARGYTAPPPRAARTRGKADPRGSGRGEFSLRCRIGPCSCPTPRSPSPRTPPAAGRTEGEGCQARVETRRWWCEAYQGLGSCFCSPCVSK